MTTQTGARRPMRADARRNYERILDVARTAFTECGAAASLDDIAKLAGVGAGTLYRHFPSREALLSAVLREWADEISTVGETRLADLPPDEALATWLRVLRRHLVTYRGLAAALVAGTRDANSELSDVCTPINRTGSEVLARAQRAGVARSDVGVREMHRLVNAVALTTEHLPVDSAETELLLTVVADGLRPR